MTTPILTAEEKVRQAFKRFLNPFMLTMWRLGMGPWINFWPRPGGRMMVIEHVGRKSGKRRLNPVTYGLVDGEVYCVAGFGSVSDWYRNILVHPEVEAWLPDGRWAAVAEEVTDSAARLPLLRQILLDSGLVAYFAGINPRGITDAKLERVTASYRVIHIRRIEARAPPPAMTGPGQDAPAERIIT